MALTYSIAVTEAHAVEWLREQLARIFELVPAPAVGSELWCLHNALRGITVALSGVPSSEDAKLMRVAVHTLPVEAPAVEQTLLLLSRELDRLGAPVRLLSPSGEALLEAGIDEPDNAQEPE